MNIMKKKIKTKKPIKSITIECSNGKLERHDIDYENEQYHVIKLRNKHEEKARRDISLLDTSIDPLISIVDLYSVAVNYMRGGLIPEDEDFTFFNFRTPIYASKGEFNVNEKSKFIFALHDDYKIVNIVDFKVLNESEIKYHKIRQKDIEGYTMYEVSLETFMWAIIKEMIVAIRADEHVATWQMPCIWKGTENDFMAFSPKSDSENVDCKIISLVLNRKIIKARIIDESEKYRKVYRVSTAM